MTKRKFNKKEHVTKHSHGDEPVVMSTLDLIKLLILNKFFPKPKNAIEEEDVEVLRERRTPRNLSINHIAIVLDGKVEEIIRAENKLAALLLSNPEFIEFEIHERVEVGDSLIGNKFVKNHGDHKHE